MMATASNPSPSPAHHSPRSPQSRRGPPQRGVTSPWTQVVRGGDSDSVLSPSSPVAASVSGTATASVSSPPLSSNVGAQEQSVNFSTSLSSESVVATVSYPASTLVEDAPAVAEGQPDVDNGSGGNAGKKPAWNKPSNGATTEVVGAVMGAVSWPALSESTRNSPKSSSSDSLKTLSDGSLLQPQGIGAGSSSQKQGSNSSPNTNSTPHHIGPTRQRSMKRSGGGSSNRDVSANGSFSHPPPAQAAVSEVVHNNSGKPNISAGEASSRDNTHRDGGQRGGSHGGNEHQQQRGSFRRGNGGPHTRGDGSHHHGHGGRRDQERGNQDWGNAHRGFSGREGHAPQQRVASRPFMRGPSPSTPFIAPPPPVAVRPPFAAPMVYPDAVSPVYYVPGPPTEPIRAVSMVPMTPLFFPFLDPSLPAKIVNQIDYYFSNENLVKDIYLRKNMDEEGWVPIKLIAGFKKVAQLTDNVQFILDAVQASNIVEVQGDKVRRKNDWMKWIMPPALYSPSANPQAIPQLGNDMLAVQLQSVTLDERATAHDAYLSRSSSGELSSNSHQSGGETTGPIATQPGNLASAANSN